ncbi:CHAT domain-containing protein [Rubinisphaera brasiliensis]|uniref:PDZ/DHR/GLGF domain protein n=1 Tax=Rubinisphaera brasiliensis (strain ATCC 49424 / DSM 5305 / JCM 21570 / IAM 15109 / NBRC 103401 / IFAM 1448) TaxID=756272 RepID=F0SR51_RUBBR|nr:CHAT domain-containing protein [Rubinisphaera brasiliensis]ADY61298.1 PDZ/DHR/GLGF domain protein [Rubinisphaera brasiliensis DSM 5305]
MSYRLAICTVCLLVCGCPTVNAQQEATRGQTATDELREARLAERDKLWAQAQQLASDGKVEAVIAAGEKVLSLERTLFGDTHEELTGTLEWLSNQNLAQQKMQSAEKHAAELLRVQEQLHGKAGWQTASARWYLDYIQKLSKVEPETLAKMLAIEAEYNRLLADGKHAEAAEKILELVPLEEEALGKEHPFIANTLSLRADRLLAAEEFPAAEVAAERALAIRRKHLGDRHPDTANAAWLLALSRIRQEKHAEALEPLELARDGWRSGGRKVYAAWTDSFRGVSLAALGRKVEAKTAYHQALDSFRELGHPEGEAIHLKRLADLDGSVNLKEERDRLWDEATSAKSDGKLVRATAFGERMLAIERVWLAEDNAAIKESLEWLAGVYEEAEDWDQAESSRREVLKRQVEKFGDSHWRATDARLALEDLRLLHLLPSDQISELNALLETDAQVIRLREAHRHSEAIKLAEQACSIRQTILGGKHKAYATSLSNLALLYESMGDYARAEPLYIQARDIRKNVYGEDHPTYATSLSNLASLYKSMGHYARAEPLYIQARDIRKNVYGEDHPTYAISLSGLAELCNEMGDYAQAESLFIQVREIYRKVVGEEHPDYAISLNNLAAVYMEIGEYERPEQLLLQARGIWQVHANGEYRRHYAMCLSNLAALYASMGDYARAQLLYLQCRDILKKALGEDHPSYATPLNNLALLYRKLGDSARAEPLLLECSKILKKSLGEQHPDYATNLNNLAALYESMGDYAKAEPLCVQAVQISGRHIERTAAILSEQQQLAFGQTFRHQLDGYLTLAQRLSDHDEEAFRLVLRWKGSTLVRQRAARLLSDEPTIAPLFADLQQVTRRWAALATAVPNPDQAESFHQQLSRLTAEKERLEIELSRQSAVFRQAMDVVTLEHLQASLPPKAAVVDFLEYFDYEWVSLPQRGGIGARLQQSDRGTDLKELSPDGAAAKDGRLQANDVIVAVATPETEWQTTVGRELSDVIALITGPAETTVRLRISREGEPEPLEISLTRQKLPYQKAGEWKSTRSLLAFVVRPGLPVQLIPLGPVAPVSEAIDVWRVAFGMSDPGRQAGALLRQRVWEPLLPALGDAETMLISPDGVLGRLPFAALPGKEPGTYLLEDHKLALVPVPQLIPALVNAHGKQQLQHDLLLMGGIDYNKRDDRDSKQPKPRRRTKPGDRRGADLRTVAAGMQWKPLDNTKKEVDFIERLYAQLYSDLQPDDVIALSGTVATEEAFRELAPRSQFLHLATHGFFATPDKASALGGETLAAAGGRNSRSAVFGDRHQAVQGYSPGLLSGLVFAGANRAVSAETETNSDSEGESYDDGIMSADEIAMLPLDGVRLVVLSACETGLGEVAGGEGLLGLQRGFQIAGAGSTIATLWEVNDLASRLLMEEFYTKFLDEELPILDALREAQLSILNHPEQIRGLLKVEGEMLERTSPEFWAAFQLSGDWR